MKNEGKELLESFETMLAKAKAKAYSKVSLERPLDDRELDEFRAAVYKAHPEIKEAMERK